MPTCEGSYQAVLPDGKVIKMFLKDQTGNEVVSRDVSNGDTFTANLPSRDGLKHDSLIAGSVGGPQFPVSSVDCNIPPSVYTRKLTLLPVSGSTSTTQGSSGWVMAGVDIGQALTARDRSALDMITLGGRLDLLAALAVGAALTWWRLRHRQPARPANRLSNNGRTMSVGGDVTFDLNHMQPAGDNGFNLSGAFHPANATIVRPANQAPATPAP